MSNDDDREQFFVFIQEKGWTRLFSILFIVALVLLLAIGWIVLTRPYPADIKQIYKEIPFGNELLVQVIYPETIEYFSNNASGSAISIMLIPNPTAAAATTNQASGSSNNGVPTTYLFEIIPDQKLNLVDEKGKIVPRNFMLKVPASDLYPKVYYLRPKEDLSLFHAEESSFEIIDVKTDIWKETEKFPVTIAPSYGYKITESLSIFLGAPAFVMFFSLGSIGLRFFVSRDKKQKHEKDKQEEVLARLRTAILYGRHDDTCTCYENLMSYERLYINRDEFEHVWKRADEKLRSFMRFWLNREKATIDGKALNFIEIAFEKNYLGNIWKDKIRDYLFFCKDETNRTNIRGIIQSTELELFYDHLLKSFYLPDSNENSNSSDLYSKYEHQRYISKFQINIPVFKAILDSKEQMNHGFYVMGDLGTGKTFTATNTFRQLFLHTTRTFPCLVQVIDEINEQVVLEAVGKTLLSYIAVYPNRFLNHRQARCQTAMISLWLKAYQTQERLEGEIRLLCDNEDDIKNLINKLRELKSPGEYSSVFDMLKMCYPQDYDKLLLIIDTVHYDFMDDIKINRLQNLQKNFSDHAIDVISFIPSKFKNIISGMTITWEEEYLDAFWKRSQLERKVDSRRRDFPNKYKNFDHEQLVKISKSPGLLVENARKLLESLALPSEQATMIWHETLYLPKTLGGNIRDRHINRYWSDKCIVSAAYGNGIDVFIDEVPTTQVRTKEISEWENAIGMEDYIRYRLTDTRSQYRIRHIHLQVEKKLHQDIQAELKTELRNHIASNSYVS